MKNLKSKILFLKMSWAIITNKDKTGYVFYSLSKDQQQRIKNGDDIACKVNFFNVPAEAAIKSLTQLQIEE